MKLLFAVGIGSFLGGILRYAFSIFLHQRLNVKFPIGTLLVNIIGCFLIGIVFEWSASNNPERQYLLFASTGLLGGFTTFSAFSFETVTMIREGQIINAVVYILLSVFIGLMATYSGIMLVKAI